MLEKEIVSIESKINYYDTYSLIVKGWAITIWIGIFLWAIQSSYLQFIWISLFPILLFWIFDAYFKLYQRKHIIRLQWIQDFLNFKGYFEKNQISISECFKKYNLPNDLLIFDTVGRTNYVDIKDYKARVDIGSNFFICFFQRYNSTIYSGLITITLIFLNIQEVLIYQTCWSVLISVIFPILIIVFAIKYHKIGRKYRLWYIYNN